MGSVLVIYVKDFVEGNSMLPVESLVKDNSCQHGITMRGLGKQPVKATSFVVCAECAPDDHLKLPFTHQTPKGTAQYIGE